MNCHDPIEQMELELKSLRHQLRAAQRELARERGNVAAYRNSLELVELEARSYERQLRAQEAVNFAWMNESKEQDAAFCDGITDTLHELWMRRVSSVTGN